jgi:hypothetical protein
MASAVTATRIVTSAIALRGNGLFGTKLLIDRSSRSASRITASSHSWAMTLHLYVYLNLLKGW